MNILFLLSFKVSEGELFEEIPCKFLQSAQIISLTISKLLGYFFLSSYILRLKTYNYNLKYCLMKVKIHFC